MRLEVLITKYLDGELTSGEDKELRQLLSQNPDAKNTFDLSISLHHALRNDASQIAPPSQLVRETEDRILMAILNQPEPRLEKKEKKKEKRFLSLFSTSSRILTGLVAVLIPLLTSSFGLEDLSFIRQSADRLASAGTDAQNSQSVADLSSYNLRRSESGNKIRNNADRTQRATSVSGESTLAESGIPTTDTPLLEAAIEEPFADNDEEAPSSRAVFLAQDLNSSGDVYLSSAVVAGPSGYPARLSTISASLAPSIFFGSPFGGISFGDRVHLSTTFGHDVLDIASGDPLGLSFVSQSLAYSLGESENAGIEVGYLWFTYGRPVQKFIPNSSNSNDWDDNDDPYGYDSKPHAMRFQKAGPDIQGQSDSSPLPDDAGGGEYITDIQVLPKQTWWGAAFYERTFTHNERISLQGRVGAGGSNDGALAYVRATGLYRVLDNLSVSVGVDARGMMLRTPYVTPKSSTIKTSLSLIYGIQLHL